MRIGIASGEGIIRETGARVVMAFRRQRHRFSHWRGTRHRRRDVMGRWKAHNRRIRSKRRAVMKAFRATQRNWELVRLYDETVGFMWNLELPLSELQSHMPPFCRYTDGPDLPRRMGTLAGGAIWYLGALLLLFPVLSVITLLLKVYLGLPFIIDLPFRADALASIPAFFAGAVWGRHKLTRHFSFDSTWVLRRIYHREYHQQPDGTLTESIDRSRCIIIPDVHTQGTGLPWEEAKMERRSAAEAALIIAMQQASAAAGPGANTMNGHQNGHKDEAGLTGAFQPEAQAFMGPLAGLERQALEPGSREEAAAMAAAALGDGPAGPASTSSPPPQRPLPQMGLAMSYTPRVLTPGILYQSLMQRDVRNRLKGPKDSSKRVQQVAMTTMAGLGLGMLVFVILISQH